MNIDEIKDKLRDAQGDPQKLALATLDIVLASYEPWMRSAIEAAAIPHWFTPPILAALLGTDEATAAGYAAGLARLPMVEPFPSRNAWNVHEATRLALRSQLSRQQPERFLQLSALAANAFPGEASFLKIETVYHRLAAAPADGALELELLYKHWRRVGRHESLQALSVALLEIIDGIPLEPVAKAESLLCFGVINRDRRPAPAIESVARQSLAMFHALENRIAECEARTLLGDVLSSQHRYAEALTEYQAYQQLMLELTAQDSQNTNLQVDLAVSHNRLGVILAALDRPAEALTEYQAYKRIMLALHEQDPENATFRRELGVAHACVGSALAAGNRSAEALVEYEAGKQIMLFLAQLDQSNALWQKDLADAYSRVGDILEMQGRQAEALVEYRTLQQIMLQLQEQDGQNTLWQRYLALSHNRIGSALSSQTHWAGALAEHLKSLEIAETLVTLDPANKLWQKDLQVFQEHVKLARSALARQSAAT